MTEPYPYVTSPGPITSTIDRFKSTLPNSVTADTLKKLSLAPNNEATVIYLLKFLGLFDEEGNKTDIAENVLYKSGNEFEKEFSAIVKKSYADLFNDYGEDSWSLEKDKLINYFRVSDKSSELVGKRKAVTFQTLAGIAGKADLPEVRAGRGANKNPSEKPSQPAGVKKKPIPVKKLVTLPAKPESKTNPFGLSVRIEVNLPSGADKETYDNIFKSIRENLIDAA